MAGILLCVIVPNILFRVLESAKLSVLRLRLDGFCFLLI